MVLHDILGVAEFVPYSHEAGWVKSETLFYWLFPKFGTTVYSMLVC